MMNNLSRWNPVSEFEDLINRYNRYFGLPATHNEREGKDLLRRSDWAPAVDIRESKEAFLIDAELPGMRKKTSKSPSMMAYSPSRANANRKAKAATANITASSGFTAASCAASPCPTTWTLTALTPSFRMVSCH